MRRCEGAWFPSRQRAPRMQEWCYDTHIAWCKEDAQEISASGNIWHFIQFADALSNHFQYFPPCCHTLHVHLSVCQQTTPCIEWNKLRMTVSWQRPCCPYHYHVRGITFINSIIDWSLRARLAGTLNLKSSRLIISFQDKRLYPCGISLETRWGFLDDRQYLGGGDTHRVSINTPTMSAG